MGQSESEPVYNFISPSGEKIIYEIGDTVTKVGQSPFSKDKICLQKSVTITQQYKLKKTIDGQPIIPTEYKENGKIYSGASWKKTNIVPIDQYSIKLEG